MNDSVLPSRAAVVIGASAGGVDALMALLPSLPAGFNAAVLLVLHSGPSRSSTLPQLLARVCALPLKEAEDKEAIVDGHVYVAPGGYHLLVEPDRSLSLSLDEPVNFARPSIDLLFESAALAYESHLLAVMLTGANNDGAEGLREVKANGGQCWAQDPKEAVARAMPDAAIATGCVDQVLPLASIGKRLAQWRGVAEVRP